MTSYPFAPGSKAGGTSLDAARSISGRAETLLALVLEALTRCPMTADEVAALIGSTPFSCRPRLSELRTMKKILDSGVRRQNASGHSAIVWDIVRKTFQPELLELP